MKIQELLSDESRWCQGSFAYDADGNAVLPDDKRAVRWCLVGAIRKCYDDYREYFGVLKKIQVEVTDIAAFNDASSFAEVRALIERLNI